MVTILETCASREAYENISPRNIFKNTNRERCIWSRRWCSPTRPHSIRQTESITSSNKRNDYEQNSFIFSIQHFNIQRYGTGKDRTNGRAQPVGEFAPKFAELNDDVTFSARCGAAPTNSACVTAAWLRSHRSSARGITDSSLTFHLQSAKNNGITRTEIAEIITHIGFLRDDLKRGRHSASPRRVGGRYCRRGRQGGFPARDDLSHRRAQHGLCTVFYREQLPRTDFTGAGGSFPTLPSSRVAATTGISTVQRGAAAKCLSGVAAAARLVPQEKGASRRWRYSSGAVIHIPANVKHWHGAAADPAGFLIWPSRLLPGESTSMNGWNP